MFWFQLIRTKTFAIYFLIKQWRNIMAARWASYRHMFSPSVRIYVGYSSYIEYFWINLFSWLQIAEKAIRDMRVRKMSQSIVVSGESGAGKTECTKYLLKYLCHSKAANVESIDQKIFDASPILEAFGNAKTSHNDNSSRFGKYVEVQYNFECQVIGANISHYLLEKSRICKRGLAERNYHVLYMLCDGASKELKDKLGLGKSNDYQVKSKCHDSIWKYPMIFFLNFFISLLSIVFDVYFSRSANFGE